MWPLDLPAREVLKPPGKTPIPWAVFDPVWYRHSYPEAAADVAGDDPAALLRYWLATGQQQGHSPNRLFDEAWHRNEYPQIAAAIAAGHYASAFDAYCRRGNLHRSPHWLFDELGYGHRNPDVTHPVLAADQLANRYDHYLRHGSQEDRIGHELFQPLVYLANFPAADVPAIRRQGVFQHHLHRLERGEPELPTTIYFDPVWYRRHYPKVTEAIAQRQWKSALHHYLCNPTPTAFDPLEAFSEVYYLARDPGLRAVIEARHFRNGYMHFLRFGAAELRSPSAALDLAWYARQPNVRAYLDQGAAPSAFAHWLTVGKHAGLAATPPRQDPVSAAAQARALSHQAAIALLPLAGRFGYSFHCPPGPAVSVVMVLHDGFATTLATIASLHGNCGAGVELILVDHGSTDETRAIGNYLPGARVLRFEDDIGWSHAANAGSRLATAAAVLFLAANARLAPGALEHARARLHSDPAIGAVGGMLIQPTGVIAQAGGILWNDGSTQDYMRGASPLAPQANFVRSVDFCSPAFFLVRAGLLQTLQGFDHDAEASGHAGADLCARIIQAGFRVIYDPSIMLFHDDQEHPAHPADPVIARHDQDWRDGHPAAPYFTRKHQHHLPRQASPNRAQQVFARHSGPSPPRLLFIDDTVPLRRIGSGFVRSNDLLHCMAELGWQMTVYPLDGCRHDLAQVFGAMPDTTEVMHDHAAEGLRAFVAGRVGYYDAIWIARTHNLRHIRQSIPELLADPPSRPLVVLDTEALAPLREAEQARLAGQPYDQEAAMGAALADVDTCDVAVAVTANEAGVLRRRGLPRVAVIGHMIRPRPGAQTHAQRAGLLFVGAIHTLDSPNLDSLVWFTEQVLPRVEDALGWETRLSIAGYTASGIDLKRFDDHPRVTLRGMVADLEPLYNAHRVFVAPTRYAAGLPYKIFEAAGHGVPIVTTELLRRQLGWTHQVEILAAGADDPDSFAAAVVRLYRDETIWKSIRERALERLHQEHGRTDYIKAISQTLSPALSKKCSTICDSLTTRPISAVAGSLRDDGSK